MGSTRATASASTSARTIFVMWKWARSRRYPYSFLPGGPPGQTGASDGWLTAPAGDGRAWVTAGSQAGLGVGTPDCRVARLLTRAAPGGRTHARWPGRSLETTTPTGREAAVADPEGRSVAAALLGCGDGSKAAM